MITTTQSGRITEVAKVFGKSTYLYASEIMMDVSKMMVCSIRKGGKLAQPRAQVAKQLASGLVAYHQLINCLGMEKEVAHEIDAVLDQQEGVAVNILNQRKSNGPQKG